MVGGGRKRRIHGGAPHDAAFGTSEIPFIPRRGDINRDAPPQMAPNRKMRLPHITVRYSVPGFSACCSRPPTVINDDAVRAHQAPGSQGRRRSADHKTGISRADA